MTRYLGETPQATDGSNITTYTFLCLWTKLVKYYIAQSYPGSTHITDPDKASESVEAVMTYVLKQLTTGRVLPQCFPKAVSSISSCLPYSRLSAEPLKISELQREVSRCVIAAVDAGLFQRVPLIYSEESFGSVQYVTGQVYEAGVQPSSVNLRKVIVLILRSVAVTLAPSQPHLSGSCDYLVVIYI